MEERKSMDKKNETKVTTDEAPQTWEAFLDHYDVCDECTDMDLEHLCTEGGGLLIAAENAGRAAPRAGRG